MSETERIVPQLTDQNEFYWKSGEDGKLRFQKCNDCAGLTYPPQQVCSHCRSLDLEVTAVSGKARLIGFTFNCLSWIEALGFCGIGEAKDFLDGGHNIALDGILPLNTHGGQLSHGRTHGMGLIHEAVTQLRGDGGERQVNDAHVAVVSSGGLTPAGAMLLTVDS